MNWYKVTKQLDEYGKKAAEARLAANLSQSDIAQATDTTQVVVSHLELGMSLRSRCINENVAADINEIGKHLNIGAFEFGAPGKKSDFSPYGSGAIRKKKVAAPKAPKPSVLSSVSKPAPKVDTVDAQVTDTILLALLTAVSKGDLQPSNALRAIKAQF